MSDHHRRFNFRFIPFACSGSHDYLHPSLNLPFSEHAPTLTLVGNFVVCETVTGYFSAHADRITQKAERALCFPTLFLWGFFDPGQRLVQTMLLLGFMTSHETHQEMRPLLPEERN
jgi:hypothetical protein